LNGERGAAAVLLLAVASLLATMLVAVAAGGQYLDARRRAVGAADASALAAAPVTFRPYGASGSPAQEAARFAIANGARLLACRCAIDRSWAPRAVEVDVETVVDVVFFGRRTVRASSRAQFSPPRLLDPDGVYDAEPP
jgi:hypothetical protein